MYLMRNVLPRREAGTRSPTSSSSPTGPAARKKGALGHLPRPARPHADRGDGDRPVLPRLDAVGRPEPASSTAAPSSRKRPRPTRSATASSTTPSSATARAPPPGPASTRRATARCPTASSSASTAASPSARRPEQAVADVERLSAVAAARKAGLQGRRRRAGLHGRQLEGLRPQQPADLPRLGHARGAPGDPGRRHRLQGRRQPARERQDRRGRRPPEGAARRALDLLHGRRRLPGPEGRHSIPGAAGKNWVVCGAYKHPAMFGFGTGIEQNTHKIGECVDIRELQHCAAFLARFPSVFAAAR